MSLALADLLRRASDVRHRSLGDEGVVLRQQAGEVLAVNEVGSRVLDLLATPRRFGDLVACLAAEFDAPADELQRDVTLFVEELLALGVVVREG